MMSHKHRPAPRQNVHRGRSPVTTPRTTSHVKAKPSAANAAFNNRAARQGSGAHKITPAQAAALQASGSKTY
jgi:hypothetical protein